MRPDTFADHSGKVHWAGNNDIDQQRQETPDLEHICDTEAGVKQDSFTKEELNEAISILNKEQQDTRTQWSHLRTKERPLEDPMESPRLNEEAREKLLELLNKCWEEEELFEDMSQADVAVICKKGKTEKPENYRPIALLNIGYKLMASMIQKRVRIRSHG